MQWLILYHVPPALCQIPHSAHPTMARAQDLRIKTPSIFLSYVQTLRQKINKSDKISLRGPLQPPVGEHSESTLWSTCCDEKLSRSVGWPLLYERVVIILRYAERHCAWSQMLQPDTVAKMDCHSVILSSSFKVVHILQEDFMTGLLLQPCSRQACSQ